MENEKNNCEVQEKINMLGLSSAMSFAFYMLYWFFIGALSSLFSGCFGGACVSLMIGAMLIFVLVQTSKTEPAESRILMVPGAIVAFIAISSAFGIAYGIDIKMETIITVVIVLAIVAVSLIITVVGAKKNNMVLPILGMFTLSGTILFMVTYLIVLAIWKKTLF